jgi:phenylacetate-coenzyme A ligase PaaK-like adenylate-forming protein
MQPCILDAWIAGELRERDRTGKHLADAVAREQKCALVRTLRHVKACSRMYGRRLAGINPETAELPELPFTEAQDISPWQDACCVPLGEVERIVTLPTSGTTGIPKRIAFTAGDLARTVAFFRIGMGQLAGPGDRLGVLLAGAGRPFGVGDLLTRALGPIGVNVRSPKEGEDLVRWLRTFRPHCIVAAPQQLERLLAPIAETAPGGVLCSSDWLDPTLANEVRKTWRCRLLDHYGLTETGFGCAVECPAHDGYHLRSLDVLIEIRDVATGQTLQPGSIGEVVVTTLDREAMPLVRYRTGDVASVLPGPCACGSPLPRLGPVIGRLTGNGLGHPAKGGAGFATGNTTRTGGIDASAGHGVLGEARTAADAPQPPITARFGNGPKTSP